MTTGVEPRAVPGSRALGRVESWYLSKSILLQIILTGKIHARRGFNTNGTNKTDTDLGVQSTNRRLADERGLKGLRSTTGGYETARAVTLGAGRGVSRPVMTTRGARCGPRCVSHVIPQPPCGTPAAHVK